MITKQKLILKETEYEQYIENHRESIKKSWDNIQPKLIGEFHLSDYNWHIIDRSVEIHDKSKYHRNEFNNYRKEFYPVNEKEKEESYIDFGWNRHIHKNPHHWNYWIIVDESGMRAIEMPFIYIFEMILDWQTFENVEKMWKDHKENMVLHEKKTIKCIERWIGIFK